MGDDEKKEKKEPLTFLGAANGAWNIVKKPYTKYKDAKEEYDTFFREGLKPLLVEKAAWEHITEGLEKIVNCEPEDHFQFTLRSKEAIGAVKQAKDSYKVQVESTLKRYTSDGPPRMEKEGKRYIDRIRLENELSTHMIKSKELVGHYEELAEKTRKEEGVSPLKYRAWQVATYTEVGTAAALVVKIFIWDKIFPPRR